MAIKTDLSRRRINELEDKIIVKSGEQRIKSEEKWKKFKESVERLPEDQHALLEFQKKRETGAKGRK